MLFFDRFAFSLFFFLLLVLFLLFPSFLHSFFLSDFFSIISSVLLVISFSFFSKQLPFLASLFPHAFYRSRAILFTNWRHLPEEAMFEQFIFIEYTVTILKISFFADSFIDCFCRIVWGHPRLKASCVMRSTGGSLFPYLTKFTLVKELNHNEELGIFIIPLN